MECTDKILIIFFLFKLFSNIPSLLLFSSLEPDSDSGLKIAGDTTTGRFWCPFSKVELEISMTVSVSFNEASSTSKKIKQK